MRPLIRNRALRVVFVGTLLVSLGMFLALWVPFWLLALGPILLGVPHVVSDIRYIVARPGLHRRRLLVILAGVPLLAGAATGDVVFAFLSALAALWLTDGSSWRRTAGTVVVVGLAGLALRYASTANLLFAHAHNFIAVGLWWVWRKRGPLHLVPVALFVGGALFLLFGPLGWAFGEGSLFFTAPSGMGIGYYADSLAPGVAPELALRLILLFAFAQSVHYTIWLRLIPEDDRPQATPRTFAATYRALKGELGGWLLAGAALVAAAVGVWALFDLLAARAGYLRAAIFHGHIELIALALVWMAGRPADGAQWAETP